VGATTLAALGAIRGGKEQGYTVGLNWYPNSVIRFLFDYQHEEINRIGTATPFRQIGQDVDHHHRSRTIELLVNPAPVSDTSDAGAPLKRTETPP